MMDNLNEIERCWTREMTQQIKVLATEPNDPSSIPETTRWKVRTDSYELSSGS